VRDRPGPPAISFTIDDTLVSASRQDTVAGNVRVEDPDGIDSVWVKLETVEKGESGGFDRIFSSRYRFVVAAGFTPGQHIPMVFRSRDIAGFQVQRDTYVVVVP